MQSADFSWLLPACSRPADRPVGRWGYHWWTPSATRCRLQARAWSTTTSRPTCTCRPRGEGVVYVGARRAWDGHHGVPAPTGNKMRVWCMRALRGHGQYALPTPTDHKVRCGVGAAKGYIYKRYQGLCHGLTCGVCRCPKRGEGGGSFNDPGVPAPEDVVLASIRDGDGLI